MDHLLNKYVARRTECFDFCLVNSPFVKEAVALEISKIKNNIEVRRQANLSSELLS